MKNPASPPLLLEKAAAWLSAKRQEFTAPALAVFLFGLFAYCFAFTNKLVNHDDASALFTKGASTAIGRWGLELVDKILPNYSMPWFYGVITLVLMTIAICLIVHIFQIRSKVIQVLLAGAIIVFPSMTGLFSYMFMSSTYALCYLFSVLAVYLVNWDAKKGFLPAVLLQILSLSLYQAHISVAAGLLVLILIRRLLYEDDVKPIVQKGFLFVTFLIVSLGAYYLLTLLIQRWCGIHMDGYASGSLSFSLAQLPADIAEAYKTFFGYLTRGDLSLIPTPASRLLHGAVLAAAAVLLGIRCVSRKIRQPGRLLLLGAMLVILPLAMNCMHLFATVDAIHTLVAFGVSSLYVLVAILCESCISLRGQLLSRAALNAATLAMTAILFINTYIANQSFLHLHLWYENTHAFYTALVADMKQTEGFTADTKLAVMGAYQAPKHYDEKFAIGKTLAGIYGMRPEVYSADRFLEYYIGISVPFASLEEKQAIRNSEAFQEMNVYPYYGCIQMIDGILVVRLS